MALLFFVLVVQSLRKAKPNYGGRFAFSGQLANFNDNQYLYSISNQHRQSYATKLLLTPPL